MILNKDETLSEKKLSPMVLIIRQIICLLLIQKDTHKYPWKVNAPIY